MASGREWGRLVLSLGPIAVGVEGPVRAALAPGAAVELPGFLRGLTVIVAATSLPGAFVSVRAARADENVTSLTNVLGSNRFCLPVAIPVGVAPVGSATVDLLLAVPIMDFPAFATLVFVVPARTHLEPTDREAYAPSALYAFFLRRLGLETAGVTETIRGR